MTTAGADPADTEQTQRMEALGQLAGGIAHDFNNNLAVIVSYTGLATSRAAELAAHDIVADLDQITHAAERASELTRRLLTFARQEVIQPQVLDLNETVVRVQKLLTRTLGENVELSTVLSAGLWPILADPGQVEQVLVNLAINARDAMPDGGTIRVDTANVQVDAESVAGGSPATPGRYVQLRVADTGTGMAPEVLAHAFEPFYTTKMVGAGTGLGLATVHRIVSTSDATIAVQSEPGAGTTFTILIPVTDQAAVTVEEPPTYRRAPQGETVLVVEDDDALREVTRRILHRNGYQVLTAANGPEAIAVAGRHPGEIHLLVTDVVMPGMLGKEVARRICEAHPNIEVLFMSGYARPILASQGRLEPGVALLDKPFSEAALIAKAGQVLNGHFRGFRTILRDGGGPP